METCATEYCGYECKCYADTFEGLPNDRQVCGAKFGNKVYACKPGCCKGGCPGQCKGAKSQPPEEIIDIIFMSQQDNTYYIVLFFVIIALLLVASTVSLFFKRRTYVMKKIDLKPTVISKI